MNIEIELTQEQAQILSDMVLWYHDCGPEGEGWKSEGAQSVADKVELAIKNASAQNTISQN